MRRSLSRNYKNKEVEWGMAMGYSMCVASSKNLGKIDKKFGWHLTNEKCEIITLRVNIFGDVRVVF
jgi:hypothetical protein